MPTEYHEGPKALEDFKTMMTKVFQAPKSNTPFAKPKKATKKAVPKGAPKKQASRRKHGKGED